LWLIRLNELENTAQAVKICGNLIIEGLL
jgi:hypothetical protein